MEKRDVRLIGICGQSAAGKSSVVAALDRTLGTVVKAISADDFFHPANALPCCELHGRRERCYEQPLSMNYEQLQRCIEHVVAVLSDPAITVVPRISHGPRNGPALALTEESIGRPLIGRSPLYILVEGVLLFGSRTICSLLHAALWLEADEVTGAQRRFERENGAGAWLPTDPQCVEFATGGTYPLRHNYKHIWKHFVQNKPRQLQNIWATGRLAGQINTSHFTPEEVASQGVALLRRYTSRNG